MKYMDAFRDADKAKGIAAAVHRAVDDGCAYRFMEFCGGHTHTIFRYGLPDLLPKTITLVHGPGCPVCVLPVGRLDMAIQLAAEHDVILCTYGDMMRVPGSKRRSLSTAKAEGADVRMVYSARDALRIAGENPEREVAFLAIGFETTAPATAVILSQARQQRVSNFSVLCNHVLTPSAVQSILESPEVRKLGSVPLDGFIGPGHVSAIIGTQPYEFFAEEYRKPVVITGFEPLDILQSLLMLVTQVNEQRAEVENQYTRVVTRGGNEKAKRLVADVFELRRRFEWRGMGMVPYSGLCLRKEYAEWDAERRFSLAPIPSPEIPGCQCGAVLRGLKRPPECKLFGKACTPDNPVGSCMVSAEGVCAAYYTYGIFEDDEPPGTGIPS